MTSLKMNISGSDYIYLQFFHIWIQIIQAHWEMGVLTQEILSYNSRWITESISAPKSSQFLEILNKFTMFQPNMFGQITFMPASMWTIWTNEGFFSSMDSYVNFHICCRSHYRCAKWTCKFFWTKLYWNWTILQQNILNFNLRNTCV